MPRRTTQLVYFGVLSALLVGCDIVPPEYEKHWVQLQKEWSALQSILTGGRSPLAQRSPNPSKSISPSGTPADAIAIDSPSARNAKANAELLQEVLRVVFIQDPKDRSQFGNLVDTLNQGASFEGLYNGFTHSTEYRKLEMAHAGASPEALKAFGEEFAWLETELPSPSEASGSPNVDVASLSDKYSRQFVGTSIFTLKRVLGDEALKVMTVKKEYPEKMALWYSHWVVRLAGRGVDFGIPLRNQADERFHYNWALGATEDRIKWEVLNRIHRVLNEANQPKQ